MIQSLLDWFAGGPKGSPGRYMDLYHCMAHDNFWVGVTVLLDFAVAAGYMMIAYHWWVNQKRIEKEHPARRALANMRNIFLFCGICGYMFIPIKMFWPAWRLYDLSMVVLVYFTWRYAWRARDLKVVYNELGKTKQLTHELEESRAEAKRKSFFLNSVSHDLRTPLNGLVLQAAVAEMSLAQKDPEMLKEAVSQMKVTARVAADLLNSFLELGRLDWAVEQRNVSDFELDGLLNDVVSRISSEADRKQLDVRKVSPPGLIVRSDRLKVARILDNLLNNAVKFTERGQVTVSAEVKGADLTLVVADTGAGIDPANVKKLFDEFYQVKNDERNHAKGFGLGLAIARRLAEHLGARISVESQLGRGSRFAVVLPGVVVATVGGSANAIHSGASPATAG